MSPEQDMKDFLAEDQAYINLGYKLCNSNDFTFSFALIDLSDYLYSHGFEKAFELVKEMTNRSHQQRALGMLYDFAKNHCTRWDTSYEELCEFMLKGWVK